MDTPSTVAHWTIRVTGLIQIVLGLFIWTGKADGLIAIHILSGSLLILSLWTLAAVAWRAGIAPTLVLVAVVWGLIVPVLGLTQTGILTGNGHWVIQVIHLLVGLGAIGQGEGLYVRIRQARQDKGLPRGAGSPA